MTEKKIPTVGDEVDTMFTSAAMKKAIHDELSKEVGFVDDKVRESLATNICDRMYMLLIEGEYETVDETERLFNAATKKMGW